MFNRLLLSSAILLTSMSVCPLSSAEETTSQWIWSSEPTPPAAMRLFRRVLALGRVPAKVSLTITADSQYEAYVNGKLAGAGNEWEIPGVYNIASMLVPGTNVIAIKAVNDVAGKAGLLIDVDAGRDFHLCSDRNWVWYNIEADGWMKPNFTADRWLPSREIGRPDSAPWKLQGWPRNLHHPDETELGKGNFVNGFRVPEGFVVDQFAGENDTSSVLCMTFNGKGQLLTAAAGNGPTEIRILDSLNGVCTGHRLFYPGLHCQGLCAIGTDIYAIGNGKLCLLADKAGQGHADNHEALGPEMLGSMTEHGPHAIVHGPDGHFYIMLGNDSSFKMSHAGEASPVREKQLYWGNLLPIQSSNFMDGVGPPGGRLMRTDIKGKEWEVVAQGFRNDYDFTFNSTGEIFAFDSDMEYDIGLPWYRPVRTVHVPFGANFGWRFGSGKWRNHLPDSTPPMNEIGRGSPTGLETYNHVAYPEEYRDAIFLCDWSRARILVMKPQRDGATWKAEPTEFLAVRGVNFPVTDACVGPDGALYFCYGGRGAKGGVLRVRYIGDKAMRSIFKEAELKGIMPAIALALNTPQSLSAFGRAAIARQKQLAGADWAWQLAAIARDSKRSDALRGRALDFLGMDAEIIDPVLLADLAKDSSAFMRAQAALRMSLNGDIASHAALPLLLSDEDPWVLRRACEGLARFPAPDTTDRLLALLGHSDRFVRFAASSALQSLPTASWSSKVFTLTQAMAIAEGLLTWAQSYQALDMDPQTIEPDFEKMVALGVNLIEAKLTTEQTIVALRALALTLLAHVEKPPASDISTAHSRPHKPLVSVVMRDRIVVCCAAFLKHDDTRISMDAAEVLGFLNDPKAIAALLEKLKNELLPREERIQYAYALTTIQEGWTAAPAAEAIEFLASPGPGENGVAFGANLKQCAARLSKSLTAEQRKETFNMLSSSAKSFAVSLQGFSGMSVTTVVDEFFKSKDFETRKKLLDTIAAAGDDEAFHRLEKLADETSPLYDTLLTLLMRFKHVEAKKYAVAALSSTSRGLAGQALQRVIELYKEDPEDQNLYYGLVVCAARSNESRAAALELLKKWPIDDKAVKELPSKPEEQIAFWEKVYQQSYKNDKRTFPELGGEGYQEPGKFQKLVDYIKDNPPAKTGNKEAGKALFKLAAKCINCHTFKGEGQQIGPELTDVAKRFDSAKILEDIVYPSKVVDARYKQILFKTRDGQRISGFASAETDDAISVTNGEAVTVTLKKADIAAKSVTDKSIMPDGLLDVFTVEQIRDLMSYLESGK